MKDISPELNRCFEQHQPNKKIEKAILGKGKGQGEGRKPKLPGFISSSKQNHCENET